MSYTVTSVNGSRDWDSKYGPMKSYKVNLKGPDGNVTNDVEVSQKSTTAAPTQGQVLEGAIEAGNYGPKFKKAQKPMGGGGGGPRPRDPGERRSIERQVAFKGAVELVSAIPFGDSNTTKILLTEFFNHGLHLIQADAAELINEVFPGTVEVSPTPLQKRAPEEAEVAASNGGKSPVDFALDEMRSLYAAWHEKVAEAPNIWANKLASVGLKDLKQASDTQLEELIAFLKEQS